jgi:predicted nucleotidyltransferase
MVSSIKTAAEVYASRTIESVTEAVKNYANDVRLAFPGAKAFLFGSWVKGTATEHSDVDVCFFLQYCGGRSPEETLQYIDMLNWNYGGMIIEPHVFTKEGLSSDHPFIKEILETGIEI